VKALAEICLKLLNCNMVISRYNEIININ